jgi:hypothetical protein
MNDTKRLNVQLYYLGGFAGATEQTVTMRFEATQITVEWPLPDDPASRMNCIDHFRSVDISRLLWVMPYDKIKDTHIDTAEKLTATRLFLTGILAFGLKKKHRYLVVSFEDEYGLEQNPVFEGREIDATQQEIYRRVGRARTPLQPVVQPQTPQAATIDVTEQIKKLGDLRDQGLLTEQEFDSKKQELLARM